MTAPDVQALQEERKQSATLVTLRWCDDPLLESRYAKWTSPVDVFGQRYAAVPNMGIVLPKRTGTLEDGDDATCSITMPRNAVLLRMSNGEPHAKVRMSVAEYTIGDVHSSIYTNFIGRVQTAERNPDGIRGAVRLNAHGEKSGYRVVMGIRVTPECNWVFGSTCCGANPAMFAEDVTITSIDRNRVTVSGLNEMRPRLWARGYFVSDCLSVGIREYLGTAGVNPFEFFTLRQLPADWLGRTVRVIPGCNKTIEDCRFYGRESNFSGIGYGTPSYHPNAETV